MACGVVDLIAYWLPFTVLRPPSAMFSPQERHLLLVIALVLVLGAVVKGCRSRVTVEAMPREELPTLDAPAKPEPSAD